MRFGGQGWALGRWLAVAWATTLAGCAGTAATNAELRAAADAETARRPAHYGNGEARAWLVCKEGAERGLLWGTWHRDYSGVTVLPAAIRKRLYDAVDLSVEITGRRNMAPLLSAIKDADPAALRRLDPATRAAVEDALPSYEVKRLSLLGLSGLMTGTALAEPSGPLPVVTIVDRNIIGFARRLNHPVLGLEPPALPAVLYQEPNGADAAGTLRLAVRRADTARDLTAWTLAAYGRGHVTDVMAADMGWRASPEDLAREDRLRTEIFTRRNAAWVPRLVERFSQPGQHFVAVGAGHLIGDDGLVALLREQGFQVTPCLNDVCS